MQLSRPVCIFLLFVLCITAVCLRLPASVPADTEANISYPEQNIHIPATTQAPPAPSLSASYACVMDADSGRSLYEKDAGKKVPMASTTKIMTALLALESGRTDEIVTASARACSMPKVHLGMQRGEQFYLSDLLRSLMLESHNDTAVAIAEHLAGSVEAFAKQMNRKAKELGLKDTHFVTPNGLDADGHHSTAKDMCRLAAYAVKNKDFLSLVQTKSWQFQDCAGKRSFSLTNKDAFLSCYDGALGIKTGFTGKAGYCFVGAASRNGITLTSCVLACGWPPAKSLKWTDTITLMNYGFQNFTASSLPLQQISLAQIPVRDGKKDSVTLRQPSVTKTLLSRFDQIDVVYGLPKELIAPVRTGQPVGTISYYINDRLYQKESIFPAESIEKSDFSDTIEFVLLSWIELCF